MNILLLITAILKIVPLVMDMIKEGKIKEATTNEVLGAFEEEFVKRFDARVERAKRAGDVDTDSLSDELSLDPHDRANKRREGGNSSGSENL